MALLEGKIALITGASRGIGKSIAQRFVQEGATVAFTYRSSDEKARALEEELTASGGKARGFKSDAGSLEQSEALHTLLKQRVANLREAAKAVCRALPASAEDEALEADRIARVAAGELSAEDAINKNLGPALDQLDEFGLLSKGLERAARMTEQNRQCTAEVTILKSELEAERVETQRLRAHADELAASLEATKVRVQPEVYSTLGSVLHTRKCIPHSRTCRTVLYSKVQSV